MRPDERTGRIASAQLLQPVGWQDKLGRSDGGGGEDLEIVLLCAVNGQADRFSGSDRRTAPLEGEGVGGINGIDCGKVDGNDAKANSQVSQYP